MIIYQRINASLGLNELTRHSARELDTLVIGFITWSLTKATPPVHFINTLRSEQNGCHFANNIFKCIILKKTSFNSNLIEVCYLESNLVYFRTDSGKGLAWNRWQAITSTKDEPLQWYMYAPPDLSELSHIIKEHEGYNIEGYTCIFKSIFLTRYVCVCETTFQHISQMPDIVMYLYLHLKQTVWHFTKCVKQPEIDNFSKHYISQEQAPNYYQNQCWLTY